jgi:peptidoglycan L-alanyl-D-glutamate endopeptidase CwlK
MKLSNRSKSQLIGVHPELAFAVTEAIKITKQDFLVFEGVRTSERQQELFDKGMSKTLDSYHLYGLAVDLVAYANGGASWDEQYYPAIIEAMNEVKAKHNLNFENGFEMWGWDYPHFQLTGYKSQYDIRTLKRG